MKSCKLFSVGTFLAVPLIGLWVLSYLGMAQAAQIGKNLDEIKKLAKKEKVVRIAASWRGKIKKAVAKGFKKKHGLSYKLTRVRGIASRERILNEAIAGVVEHDLVNVSGELRPQYKKAGVIVPLEWQKLFPDVKKIHFSSDKYFVGTGFSRYGIIYNPKLVPAERVPKSWEDCLDPYWKGKLAVYTRPRTFTGLWAGWGKERSLNFHKKLKANQPVWTGNQTATITQVAAGEYPMGCGFPFHTHKNVLRRDPKASIKFVVPTELPIQVGEALSVMKGGKAPNASILLASYLASEGQSFYHLYGRSSPFVEGTAAWKVVQETGTKLIFGGWEFAGEREADAARQIVEAWGFPKAKKAKRRR